MAALARSSALFCAPWRTAVTQVSRAPIVAHFVHSNGYATKASASNVKQLREQTGLPIKMCMDALKASDNDISTAMTYLSENEQTRAEMAKHKLSSRETSAGRLGVALSADLKLASMVEVLCETDFVARNAELESLTTSLAREAVESAESKEAGQYNIQVQDVLSRALPNGDSCQALFDTTLTSVGENVVFSRASVVSAGEKGVTGAYVHGNWAHAAVVACEASTDLPLELAADVSKLCEQLAAHVVALRPTTVEGTDDSALLQQSYVFDSSKSIATMVEETSAKVNSDVKISDFLRWERGL